MRTITIIMICALALNTMDAKSQDLNYHWGIQLKCLNGQMEESCITKDQYDNLLISGYYSGTVDFDPGVGVYQLSSGTSANGFLLKLNPEGQFLWVKEFKSSQYVDYLKISVTAANEYLVSMQFKGTFDADPDPTASTLYTTGIKSHFCVVKLSSTGGYLWSDEFSSSNADMTCDSLGNIYLGLGIDSTTDINPNLPIYNVTPSGYQDLALVKLDANGMFIWAKQFHGLNSFSSYSNPKFISPSMSKNLFLAFQFHDIVNFDPDSLNNIISTNSSNSSNAAVVMLDSSGLYLRHFPFYGMKGYTTFISALIQDSLQQFHIFGSFKDTIDADPGPGVAILSSPTNKYSIFYVGVDSLGNTQWVKTWGNNEDNVVRQAVLKNDNRIYITGFNYNNGSPAIPYDVNPDAGVDMITPTGEEYSFLNSFGIDGSFLGHQEFMNSHLNASFGLTNTDYDIYLAGMFIDTMDCDPSSNSATIFSDSASVFIIKLGEYPLSNTHLVEESMAVYPNPSSDELTLEYKGRSNNMHYNLLDMQGRILTNGLIKVSTSKLNVSQLESGLYILVLLDEMNRPVAKTKFIKE